MNSDFVSKYPRSQGKKTEIATIKKCFIIIKKYIYIHSFFQSEDTIVSRDDMPELTCGLELMMDFDYLKRQLLPS